MTILTIAPWIIIGCWIAFMATWVISSFSAKRDIHRNRWQQSWRIRLIIVLVLAAWAWHANTPNRLHYNYFYSSNHLTNVSLVTAATLLCFCGILLAIWARLHLGKNWSSTPNVKEGHELVTTGPYRVVRHPIYTGILMAVLGSVLLSWYWGFVFIIVSIMFVRRIRIEEKLMMEQFPKQYPEYIKNTWALVPYVL